MVLPWCLGSATVRPCHLLIKTPRVAPNPIDWKRVAIFNEMMPHTVGLDVAGWVVACGDEVSRREYKGSVMASRQMIP